MATEQVSFQVGDALGIASKDPAFVGSIKKFIKDNEHDFLTFPQDDGSFVKARKDSIPFFIFKNLSDLIDTSGRHIALVKDEPKDEQSNSNGDTPNSGQDNSVAGSESRSIASPSE